VDIAEPKRLGTKCQTQAVKIAWAAAADGLEANDADGEAFSFTTVKA
jgi:isoleucyl-tRNA synthetase